jgi:hypothetical protein
MFTCAFALVPASRLSQSSYLASLLLFVPLVLSAEAIGAAHPITFDAPTTIAVRDVTTDEHRIAYPAARLIEVKIQISSLVRRGQEREIQELFYRFDYPAPGIEVVDYLPKTTLSSDVVGNIGMEKRSEDSSTLGLSLSGMMQPLAGTLTGGITDKESQSIRYELLPPMETVAASGTLNRRTSVYFKLRPTPRDSLEGDKEFVVIVRVPATWRGDYVYWGCQAAGSRRSAAPGLDSSAPVGRRQFVMSLYLEGDEEAREVAERFSWAELRLRRVAVRHDSQISKRATPTVVHKVGAWLSVVPRKIPDDWLEHLLIASPHAAASTLLPQLPEPVQKAARDYLLAKQQLAAMGTW